MVQIVHLGANLAHSRLEACIVTNIMPSGSLVVCFSIICPKNLILSMKAPAFSWFTGVRYQDNIDHRQQTPQATPPAFLALASLALGL